MELLHKLKKHYGKSLEILKVTLSDYPTYNDGEYVKDDEITYIDLKIDITHIFVGLHKYTGADFIIINGETQVGDVYELITKNMSESVER